MSIADLVKDSTTTVGLGSFVLSGSPPVGFQSISAIGGIGSTFGYICGFGTSEWECGQGTITAANTVARSPTASSNGGALVNFSAGTKTFMHVVTANDFNKFARIQQSEFLTSIPLTTPGVTYMAPKTINSALTFTPAANAVRGALVYLRLVADGVNLPVYSAFKEWGGSLGYDNRAGIENQMQFFFDGFNYWVSISQALNAVAVPLPASAVSVSGPNNGIVGQASSAFTVGVTPVGGAITGTVVVTPADGAGGTFTPSSISLSSGTTSATFTYTPASTGAKSISFTNNGGLTNPSAITYAVAASATAPGAPTIGTAVAGSGYIDVAFTAPASNGGANILDYTATLSTGQTSTGTVSPIRVTSTNGTAATATVTARNVVGPSVASAASNSVTSIATLNTRLTSLSSMTESGTGPYSYTGTGATYGGTGFGGISNMGLKASQDGSLAFTIAGYTASGGNEQMIGILNSAFGLVPYTQLPYAFYTQGSSGKYLPITNGALGGASSVSVANGDIVRLRRSGTSLIGECSKDGGATWLNINTWTGVPTTTFNFQVSCAQASRVENLAGTNLG